MFLSANNFYYKVTKSGDVMTRVGRWRDLGRPEAALTGVGFIRFVPASEPYVRAEGSGGAVGLRAHGPRCGVAVRKVGDRGRRDDDRLAEGDAGAGGDPRPRRVRRDRADDVLRDARGAKVFAAGAFTLAGAALWPDVSRVLANLWSRLATE